MARKILALLFVLFTAVACSSTSTDAEEDLTIVSQGGLGGVTSIAFEADGPWRLKYAMTGLLGAVRLIDEDNGTQSILVGNPGSGTVRHPRGGNFRLEVATDGTWAIRVLKIEP